MFRYPPLEREEKECSIISPRFIIPRIPLQYLDSLSFIIFSRGRFFRPRITVPIVPPF